MIEQKLLQADRENTSVDTGGCAPPVLVEEYTEKYLSAGGYAKPYPMTLQRMFKSHGREYGICEHGVIHQLDAKPYEYTPQYIATYNTESYTKDNDRLQALRLGFVIGAHGAIPESILDVGYGNGAFLKAADIIPRRFGKDVTGYNVEGVHLVDEYVPVSVVTFHDCLEHIADITFVKDLQCETIVVSLPYCHDYGDWFNDKYKHRKPDEHIHHFNPASLRNFMYAMGWITVAISTHEDIVRKSPGDWKNILSMAFKRK